MNLTIRIPKGNRCYEDNPHYLCPCFSQESFDMSTRGRCGYLNRTWILAGMVKHDNDYRKHPRCPILEPKEIRSDEAWVKEIEKNMINQREFHDDNTWQTIKHKMVLIGDLYRDIDDAKTIKDIDELRGAILEVHNSTLLRKWQGKYQSLIIEQRRAIDNDPFGDINKFDGF